MRKFLLAGLSLGSLLASVSAHAATTSTTFNVNATVLANCLASASALNFGNYTPASGNVSSNTTISVRCTNKTPFTVALNQGSTTGGAFAQRLLTDASGDTLQYNLYKDPGFTTIFGDGTQTTQTAAGTGTGMAVASAQSITVYGSLLDNATNQTQPAGSYSDLITVTVSY